MNKVDDIKEAKVVFEYAKDPMFRSTHADGFIGGLTPNGHIHLAFFSERPLLPKKHVFRINPDGSLGPEIVDEKTSAESIVRDLQVDVLMTVNAAEGLRSWLDQYIKNMKARQSSAIGDTRVSTIPGAPQSLSKLVDLGAAQ
jgi:hypothetical protein